MKPFQPLSTVEQLVAHMRDEIHSGGLVGEMPGVARLVRELGVGTKTATAAMEILIQEGLIEPQGKRRRSRIAAGGRVRKAGLRIRILLYEENDMHNAHIVRLTHRIEQRGHRVGFATKTLRQMQFDVKRVARIVNRDEADAWIILAGSRPVLEWFASQPFPAFALFGRQSRLPIASLANLKSPAIAETLRHLVNLGHSRIVMLARSERREPTTGLMERRFVDELERLGIQTGDYNLPAWKDDPEGLEQCLDSLFSHTPPTALFLNDSAISYATQHYLLAKGVAVPRDVSLVSLNQQPDFDWFRPGVSHIRVDTQRWNQRIVQWVDHVAKGKQDRRETLIEAQFVLGGTIGPARVFQ